MDRQRPIEEMIAALKEVGVTDEQFDKASEIMLKKILDRIETV